MIIKSVFKDYNVSFNYDFGFLSDIAKKQNLFYVIDKNVYNLYSHMFKDIFNSDSPNICIVEANEENKVIETFLSISSKITEAVSSKRNTLLVSIGGGIIQDITGFIAGTLYRGIGWIYVPTTLLAACDSCIGGKSSLNYNKYKNLIGSFYPPDEIYICTLFFDTLSELDYKSGLGEIVKFNVLRGIEGISELENEIELLIRRDKETVNKFIKSSLGFKKYYIENDEFDRGVRLHLNFAHTFGHALETSSNYSIPHGCAVVIGMLIANHISLLRGRFNAEHVERIEKLCRSIIINNLENSWFDEQIIINSVKKDKKRISNNLTAVLIYDNFDITICNNILETEIVQAIKYIKEYLFKVGSLL